MKKILQFLFVSIVLLSIAPSAYAIVCDQVFEGTYLRYDKTYRFYDDLHNSTNRNVYINERKIRFMDNMTSNEVMTSSYLDPGSPFGWTQQLKNANYTVAPKSSMRIIETWATKWRVDRHPATRTQARKNNHDFMIYYKIDYDFSNNYPNASDDISHVECQYFSVTWCGDGIRDAGYEVCDPSDPTRIGWGNGGCDNSCQPITVNPPATCDGLSVNPNSGQAPFTTTLTCSGTNADSYQIQCGNGQVINGRTGTCSYSTGSNYQAQCIVNGNITSNACKKTVTVINPNPGIRIDKLDANSDDLDENIGNDTQTVATGTQAVFKIRVTNSWNEPLTNLRVIDTIAPNCGGNVTLPSTKPATWSNFIIAGSWNNSNNTLEVGEYFEYTCVKPNTISAYDNEAITQGTWLISGQQVSDYDDTEVLLITPSIQVIKLDANQNDLDANIWDDTQTVLQGQKAVFQIQVTNNGTEILKNISLTDPLEPSCNRTNSQTLLLIKNIWNWDEFLDPNESFTYLCEKQDTQENYVNEIFVSWIWVESNTSVTDDDLTNVLVQNLQWDIYDLALRKTLSSTTPGPFNPGGSVVFNIWVFNQGDIDSGQITITDYIPVWLTLNDPNWTQSGNTATRNISNIPAGGDTTLTIRFTINTDATGAIRNFAEISADSGDDCDSTPDAINGNGTGESTWLIDDDIWNGCNIWWDEDDHDVAEIFIWNTTSACTWLTASPSSARNSLTSTITCTGNNATSFKIEVRNAAWNIINTINNASGQVTLNTVGSYIASCFVNNETSAIPACTTTLSVTTWGGGWSDHSCVDIEQINTNTVRCYGFNAFVMGVTYTSSGSTMQQSWDNLTRTETGRLYADFILPADATNIQCLASKKGLEPIAEGLQDWRWWQQCRFNLNPICWDWVVDNWEQCDFWTPFTSQRWGRCGLPGASNQCRFSGGGWSTPDCSSPWVLCWVITIPDEWEFIFGPRWDIIVGHTQNPLSVLWIHPILENNSDYDISFDRFCVKSMNNTLLSETVLNGSSDGEICVNIENRTIYPYEKLYLVQNDTGSYKVVNQFNYTPGMSYPQFRANKDVIPVWDSYAETRLVTSVKDTLPLSSGGTQQFDFYDTFLAGNLNVRVARPAVSTVWWGTSYVKSTTTSDVAVVTQGIAGMIWNTNFVGTSVSDGWVSSDSAVVTNTDASSDDKKMHWGIDLVRQTGINTNFVSYNGIDNVFVKSGNHIFSSTPSWNGARTYIVENGDVIISGNIDTNDNIAIIVRSGNIFIWKDVEKINATLMVLWDATKIIWQASEKQLRVNGALYGNIDDLVSNRYYIDGSGSSLSVGTIVSFGSNLLRRPAPLLSQFVWEYLESQRVAR